MDLPRAYSEVRPTDLKTSDVFVPACDGNLTSPCNNLNIQMQKEFNWLHHVKGVLPDNEISSDSNISWAAYHAGLSEEPDVSPSINAMLPLFTEEASSPSMLHQCFDVANPGQVPVICADQPRFA